MRRRTLIVVLGLFLVPFVTFLMFRSHGPESPFTVIPGKGVSNLMDLDDSPLWLYLTHLGRSTFTGHFLDIPSLGMMWSNGGSPQIDLSLDEDSVKFVDEKIGTRRCPFKGYVSRLGVLDKTLTVERVIHAYGGLPIFDDDRGLGEPILRSLMASYPLAIRMHRSAIDREPCVIWNYYDQGIAFRSYGQHVESVAIFHPRQYSPEHYYNRGVLRLGVDEVRDVGIWGGAAWSMVVVIIENDTCRTVELAVTTANDRLFAHLGTKRLAPNESTILAIARIPGVAKGYFEFLLSYGDVDGSPKTRHCVVKGFQATECSAEHAVVKLPPQG